MLWLVMGVAVPLARQSHRSWQTLALPAAGGPRWRRRRGAPADRCRKKIRELFAMNQPDGAISRSARRAPGRLPARFDWNAARTERLCARWAQGLSAGTIASELGTSRSAVL